MSSSGDEGTAHAASSGFCETDSSGFIWRKYGEKTVGARKSAVKRAYFKCLCHKAQDPCPAKKRVDRLISSLPGDPPLSVSYLGRHNHRPRTDLEGQGERESKGAGRSNQEDINLQRTGFEKMKPEELAREMWRDIMVHMAEAAAISSSMGGDGCGAMCMHCHHCSHSGRVAGARDMAHVRGPLELELPVDSSDELSSEANGLLATLLEGSDMPSPCPISPSSRSPLSTGPSTDYCPPFRRGDESPSDEPVTGLGGAKFGSISSFPTKTEPQEDVRSVVEKLQHELRSRKHFCGGGSVRNLGKGSAVAVTHAAQDAAVTHPAMGMVDMGGSGDVDPRDELFLEFPPLDLEELNAHFNLPEESGTMME